MNDRRPITNLVGNKYGSVIVLSRHDDKVYQNRRKIMWKCKCTLCNREFIVSGDNLRSGNTTSCGCWKHDYNNLVGIEFGKLTVIEETSRGVKKSSARKYKCICKCGNTENILGVHLIAGNTTSCKECTEYEYEDLSGKIFNYLQVIDLHRAERNKKRYWRCKCLLCGSYCIVEGSAVKGGYTKSCGCLKSNGEKIITMFLISKNIQYEKEYTFYDLKSKMGRHLRFDFAIFNDDELLGLIEFQGIQHFRNIFNINAEKWEDSIERDILKQKYCVSNNIKLYTINYDSDIEKELGVILSKLKIS